MTEAREERKEERRGEDLGFLVVVVGWGPVSHDLHERNLKSFFSKVMVMRHGVKSELKALH